MSTSISQERTAPKPFVFRIGAFLLNILMRVLRIPLRFISWIWINIGPYVPGTYQFEYRQQRNIVQLVRKKRSRFNNLRTIPLETKHHIYRQMRNRLKEAALIESWQQLPSSLWTVSGCTMVIFMFFISPQAIRLWLDTPDVSFWSAPILAIVGFYVTWSPLIIFTPFVRKISRTQKFPRTLHPLLPLWFLLMYILIVVYMFLIPSAAAASLPDLIKFALVAGLLIYPMILIPIIAGGIIFIAYRRYVRWWARQVHLEAVLLDRLIALLEMAEDRTASWNNLSFKRQLLEAIENCSSLMQVVLPSRLATGDEATRIWTKRQFEGMANATRDLKKWVILPMPDTQTRFCNRVAEILVPIAQGDWHNVPQIDDTEDLPLRATVTSRILGFVRVGLKAAPAILWLVFQQSPYALTGPLADSLTVFAFSLIVAVIVEAFGVNIDTIKAAAGLK